MLIAVKDACVLIDLANGGLVSHWFLLQIETHTTDAVVFELEDEAQYQEVILFVEAGLIKVTPMYGGDGFTSLQTLAKTAATMGVSVPDASAFLLARKLKAVLLTGDGDLRKQSKARGVTVCGVLWVLDMLVWHDAITFELAADSLTAMLEKGARLPEGECARRFRAWGEGRNIQPSEPSIP